MFTTIRLAIFGLFRSRSLRSTNSANGSETWDTATTKQNSQPHRGYNNFNFEQENTRWYDLGFSNKKVYTYTTKTLLGTVAENKEKEFEEADKEFKKAMKQVEQAEKEFEKAMKCSEDETEAAKKVRDAARKKYFELGQYSNETYATFDAIDQKINSLKLEWKRQYSKWVKPKKNPSSV